MSVDEQRSLQVAAPATSSATSSSGDAGELAPDVYAGWTSLQRAIDRSLVGALARAARLNDDTRRLLARIG